MGSPRETSSSRQISSTVLVGRSKELERLTSLFVTAPALATVEGEAGIGKTRLVRELVSPGRVPQRYLVLVGCCQPVREPFPLGPVADAISGVAPRLEGRRFGPGAAAAVRIVPELRGVLPEALAPLDDPRAERHVLLRSVRELLAGLGPAILVLEDLHWADDATFELLALLQSRFPPDLVVVGTYRREELDPRSPAVGSAPPPGVRRDHIKLAPLDVPAVGQLVSAILDTDDVTEALAAYLHERTAGIPFAVEEVVRLLQDRRDLVRRGGTWIRTELDELAVPSTLAESILERLGRLRESAQRIVEAASVLGVPATEGVLARVADLPRPQGEPAVTDALASALLHDETSSLYGVRHPLAQQAIYESIPGPRRRAMHRRAIHELEHASPKPVARLAHHCREAGDVVKWMHYAEESADLAAQTGDDANAYVLLSQLIDSPARSGESRARLAVKFGRAAYHSAAYEEAVTVLRRIIAEETLSAGQRGELRLLLGLLLDRVGNDDVGFVQIEKAVGELQGRDALLARAMSALTIPTFGEPHVSRHLEWAAKAVEVVARVEDPVIRMAVLGNHASILLATGAPDAWDAVARIPAARTPQEKRERIRCCHNVANEAMGVGSFEQAEPFLEEAESLSRELSYDRLELDLGDLRCFLDWGLGRWEGLEGRCRHVLSAAADSGSLPFGSEIVLGLLGAARGDLDEARKNLEPGSTHARDCGGGQGFAVAKEGLSRIFMAQGRVEEAIEEAFDAIDHLRRKGVWTWAAGCAAAAVDALVAGDRRREAIRLVEELSEGVAGMSAPAAQAWISMCRGGLAGSAGLLHEAASHYQEAERLFRSLAWKHPAVGALEGRGLALLSTGDATGGVLLEECLVAYEQLGASWDANRTRRLLRKHGVSLVHRRGRRGYGRQLSPRELEVAALAAEGLTNVEIASRLFLSPATVKHHVAAAMRKLGVASRAEFAATLAEAGGKWMGRCGPVQPGGGQAG